MAKHFRLKYGDYKIVLLLFTVKIKLEKNNSSKKEKQNYFFTCYSNFVGLEFI